MTGLKTSIKTITYLSDIGCLEIQGASLDVKKLVDTTVSQWGRIDVLINNAGAMPLLPLDQVKVSEWNQMIDVGHRKY